jgi:Glycosyl transferase family 2
VAGAGASGGDIFEQKKRKGGAVADAALFHPRLTASAAPTKLARASKGPRMPSETNLVGLCVAKNEADIIEPMVRHNLGYLDHLHVVDNDSADATPGILAALQGEFGGRLTWSADPRVGHGQQAIINEMLPKFAELHDAAQTLLLDADEFLRGDIAGFRGALLSSDQPVQLPWFTYVPSDSDASSEPNPLARITQRRRREVPQYSKITVPRGLVGHAQVGAGNHSLIAGKRIKSVALAGLSLAHFPVRSREQLISKVLIGSWNMRLRAARHQNEAYHWRVLADRILGGDMLTDADVQSVALSYAADVAVRLIAEPMIAHGAMILRYTPDNAALLERNLIAFAESCVRQLSDKMLL